jgi:hypothetical protein
MNRKFKLSYQSKDSDVSPNNSQLGNEEYGEAIPTAYAWQTPDELMKRAEKLEKPIY